MKYGRALLRMDIGFYRRAMVWRLVKSLQKIRVLRGNRIFCQELTSFCAWHDLQQALVRQFHMTTWLLSGHSNPKMLYTRILGTLRGHGTPLTNQLAHERRPCARYKPRGSTYCSFQDPGSKNYTCRGVWNQGPQIASIPGHPKCPK